MSRTLPSCEMGLIPIPLVPGRDNSAFGTYANGVDWAATRARVAMPIGELYAKLLDHRNHKDMKKTVLETTELERPGYLAFQRVDGGRAFAAGLSPRPPLETIGDTYAAGGGADRGLSPERERRLLEAWRLRADR